MGFYAYPMRRINRHIDVYPTGLFEYAHVCVTLLKAKWFMHLNIKIKGPWRIPFPAVRWLRT